MRCAVLVIRLSRPRAGGRLVDGPIRLESPPHAEHRRHSGQPGDGRSKAQFEIGPVATHLAADESLTGQFVQVRVGQPALRPGDSRPGWAAGYQVRHTSRRPSSGLLAASRRLAAGSFRSCGDIMVMLVVVIVTVANWVHLMRLSAHDAAGGQFRRAATKIFTGLRPSAFVRSRLYRRPGEAGNAGARRATRRRSPHNPSAIAALVRLTSSLDSSCRTPSIRQACSTVPSHTDRPPGLS